MTPIEVPDWVVEIYRRTYRENFVDGRLMKVEERVHRALTAALGAWVVHEGWKYEGLYPNVPPFRKDRADGYTAPLYTLRQEKPE